MQVPTQQQSGTLSQFIDELQEDFEKSLVDDRINFDREKHFAIQILMSNDYLLNTAKKNSQSLKNAIVNIAAVGLSLNPVSALAYLVPRYINKKPTVTLEISYKGLIRAATDSGSILWAQSDLVYENDNFIIKGFDEPPTHERSPFSKNRGELVGAYVVVKTPNNDYLTTAMSIEETFEIRNKSEAFKNGHGPWKDFEGEMIKKTVVKRASKMWPRTPRIEVLEKAIDICNETEGIDFEEKKEEIQEEKRAIEADFKKDHQDSSIRGTEYVFIWGKFRDKKMGDVDLGELKEYFEKTLKPKVTRLKNYQVGEKFETFERIEDYLENFEGYQNKASLETLSKVEQVIQENNLEDEISDEWFDNLSEKEARNFIEKCVSNKGEKNENNNN